VSAAAAMRTEDATPLVPFAKMSERDKDGALAALATEIAKLGVSSSLIAKLAGALRRAADGSFHLDLEIPRLSGFPSSKWIGGGHVEPWALKIISNPHEDVAQAFWLATETKTMPLSEAVELAADPGRSPIAELSRRRVEVERRRAEGAAEGAAHRAEREREQAAARAWETANSSRMKKWGALPRPLQDVAEAARMTGDPVLIAFAKHFVEASTATWSPSRPPDFLWPLS